MLPRMLGLAVTQLNFLVNLYFASQMVEGSNSALNVAWFLMFFVLGVIAQSVGTAVFPSLARLAAEGDLRGFGSRVTSAMSGVLFLAIPASVGLIVLGVPVVALMVERGEWLPDATAGTAWALAFFAIGIAGHGLLEVLSRAFYALSDTRTPVLIGIASLASNIVLSIVFIRFIGDPASLARGPIACLALANSVTTLLEAAALWWLLSRRLKSLDNRLMLSSLGRSIASSILMGVLVTSVVALLSGQSNLILVAAGGLIGAISYFALTAALGVAEARAVPLILLRRFRR